MALPAAAPSDLDPDVERLDVAEIFPEEVILGAAAHWGAVVQEPQLDACLAASQDPGDSEAVDPDAMVDADPGQLRAEQALIQDAEAQFRGVELAARIEAPLSLALLPPVAVEPRWSDELDALAQARPVGPQELRVSEKLPLVTQQAAQPQVERGQQGEQRPEWGAVVP